MVGAGSDFNNYSPGWGYRSSLITTTTGAFSAGSYSPGSIGGYDQYKMIVEEMPTHNLTFNLGRNFGASYSNDPAYGFESGRYAIANESVTPVTVSIQSVSIGNSWLQEHRPPYYSLAYIMKL